MSVRLQLAAWATSGGRLSRDVTAMCALLALAACGSDTTTEPVTTFTPADQLAIAGQVAVPAAVAVGLLTPDLSTATVHGPSVLASTVARLASRPEIGIASNAAVAATFPVDRIVNCPAGGSTHTTGTLTGSLAAGGSGALNFLLFTSFAACGVASDGRTLLLTADPGLEVKGSYVVTNRVPVDPQTLSITGSVSVAVAGSRAVAIPCVIFLTVTTSASTHVSNVSGTVCGATVSRQFTWSP